MTNSTDTAAALPFWKMHGAGNDFVVAEAQDIAQDSAPGSAAGGARTDAEWAEIARAICDRHFGVGADGLILVLPSASADRRMRMFNPDGSESEMCGNGLRCFVKYVVDQDLVPAPLAADGASRLLTVETAIGVLHAEASPPTGPVTRVRVEMGVPGLAPAALGMTIDRPAPVLDLAFEAAGDRRVTLVSMGNPHAVEFIADPPAAFPVHEIGPAVEHHELFPNRTNVEFVQVADRSHLHMRVWERGAGETLACGSGACAAAVAAHLHGYVDDTVDVHLPGGTLRIEWDGSGEVYLSGPAVTVYVSTFLWNPDQWDSEQRNPEQWNRQPKDVA